MLVNAALGTVMLTMDDGSLVTLPYEPLSEAEMLLQARYHLFLRSHEYRRELVCCRCKTSMVSDNQANEGDQTWEILSRCQCRAIYGTIPLHRIASTLTS